MQGKKASILIVEDDLQIRQLMETVLNQAEFHATSVGSGEEALDILLEMNPSLIILDIGLPGIDGFTTCQRMRLLTRVPIVMLTGKEGPVDTLWGMEIGADDYITKPFWPEELVARINAQLRRSGTIQEFGAVPDYAKLLEHMTAYPGRN